MYKMVVQDELPPSNAAQVMKVSKGHLMNVVYSWRKKGMLQKKLVECRQVIRREEEITHLIQ